MVKGIFHFLSQKLAKDNNVDLYLIERTYKEDDLGIHVHQLVADVINERSFQINL